MNEDRLGTLLKGAEPVPEESDFASVETISRQGRRRTRKRRATVSAVGVMVLAVALALPLVLPNGRGGAQPAAAALLLQTSRVAARQPATSPPGVGQFVYTKSVSSNEVDAVEGGANNDGYFSVLVPVTREIWIGTDGSGRLREAWGTPRFLSSHDRSVWIADGRPSLGANTNSDQAYGPGGLAFTDLSRLPTDPQQLRNFIEERKAESGPPGDGETFTIIGDLLRETYASPALRSALFHVAAEIPGVVLVGHVTDPMGRSGVAVAYPSGGVRHELIFNPNTAALLAERSIVTDPPPSLHVAPGTVVGWTAYLASGVVNSTSKRS